MGLLLLQAISFFKILLMFLAILNCLKESFKLYKSIKLNKVHEVSKNAIVILALSISYLLTLIFI